MQISLILAMEKDQTSSIYCITCFRDDVVVAVANAGPVPVAIQFLELFKRKIKVTREDVEKNESDDWLAWLDK
ncbi:hypothetical protein Y032_0012g1662 [Ancylostoma ceylanicum]|uniref:Uncharacterized protein n=1 Tax=Ancylostoma ceylanicum TaxID=53326 RepID=A0A016VEB3_9BILA|nr:hypothetical protein Y032_0012g1662 [Ancylostoma ceylanicum]